MSVYLKSGFAGLLLGLTVVGLAGRVSGQAIEQQLRIFGTVGGGSPEGGLLMGSDGVLYGQTAAYPRTVFRLEIDGSGFTVLHVFSGGDESDIIPVYAGLMQAVDGALYGTTRYGGTNNGGTLFKLNTDGTGFVVLHIFEGAVQPRAALLQGRDGALYGTTQFSYDFGEGCVFKINTDGSGYTRLHTFTGIDGAQSIAPVIQGTDGMLYGTTSSGGNSQQGTVFKLNPNGTGYRVLHSFQGGQDGAAPSSAVLLGSDGTLYGTTLGTATIPGTIFKLSTNGTEYSVIQTFPAGSLYGSAGYLLQFEDGVLYGTTFQAQNSDGTVFKVMADGTSFSVLHTFDGPRGGLPSGALARDAGGNFYGAALLNGLYGEGTVFMLSTDGTKYSVLHNFSRSGGDAQTPFTLVQSKDGVLYGACRHGWIGGLGGVFRLNPDGSDYKLLVSLPSLQVMAPGNDGQLYAADGNNIYWISTNGNRLLTLATGLGSGLGSPGLIQGSDGSLYGTSIGRVFKD